MGQFRYGLNNSQTDAQDKKSPKLGTSVIVNSPTCSRLAVIAPLQVGFNCQLCQRLTMLSHTIWDLGFGIGNFHSLGSREFQNLECDPSQLKGYPSKDKFRLLQTLVVLGGMAASVWGAVPVLAQSTSPQASSSSPVIVPLQKDDSTSNVDPLSTPVTDTVMPTSVAPTPFATPTGTAPEVSTAPTTFNTAPSTAPLLLTPEASAAPLTFTLTPSATPTTPTATPTAVLTPTEATPVATPVTPTPPTVINSETSDSVLRTLTIPNSSGFNNSVNQ
ncbi:hypothetical protein H6F96_22020 [Microcoleus sp. FACHB-53]|nr:hypothetical protein [Microcoleus sp. FACHB-53]